MNWPLALVLFGLTLNAVWIGWLLAVIVHGFNALL